jgi:tripartite-type tricarboxylate transporter receptor subunit TctC
MFLRKLVLSAIAALGLVSAAPAQDYPNKPVTIILPLAAGSGLDIIARIYAEKLQEGLGKPVIVENRPGAALMLATQMVATAPPDGYTLLVATSSAMAINPVLYKQINYDPAKGFIPISLYLKSPFILVVNPDLPAKNVRELIALAKQRTDLNYSSPGAGVAQHLSMEFMKNRFGLEISHVPYRNTPQSILDIASGHVQLGFVEAGASLPLIKDGKLRPLAVSSAARLPILPDVPPFSEASGAQDFEAVSWHTLLAPAGTPRPIIDRLHNEMKRIMADPTVKERIANLGLVPTDTPSVEGITTYLAEERAKWGALVRKLGLEGTQ